VTGVVPSDNAVYNEANVRRQRVVWREEPAVSPVLPDARRIFERHMPEHPLIRYPELDGTAITFSDFYSRPRFHDLGLYQEFFRRLSLEHQLAVKVPALAPLLIVLCVNRSGGCDFSGRDRILMNLVRPHLVQAYRNAEVFTELRRGMALLDRGADGRRRALVVLTGDGRIGFATDRALRWLDRYFGAGRPGPDRPPAALLAWLRRQEGGRRAADDPPRPRTPLVVDGPDGHLEVRLASGSGRRLLLLAEHPARPRRRALEALGLSRREAEVLAWVAEGKTNPEIAVILGLSRRTVGNHLARIYARLGVETRTAAARLALVGAEP
jgi:DNA-binding CsgD family transcriptional regulator